MARFGDRARTELQRKLRLAVELERKARAEVDRLSSVADECGWSTREIADALGERLNTVQHRKRAGWQRGHGGRRPKNATWWSTNGAH